MLMIVREAGGIYCAHQCTHRSIGLAVQGNSVVASDFFLDL